MGAAKNAGTFFVVMGIPRQKIPGNMGGADRAAKGSIMSTPILPRKIQNSNTFEQVREIPFPAIVQRFTGEAPNRSGKISCPFHQEKTPSFQIYPDGGHCFGCGWHGDGVAFVAELRGLQPIEAALLIAREFNIPIATSGKHLTALTAKEHKQWLEAARAKETQSRYKQIKKMAFLALVEFRDLAAQVFNEDKLDIDPDLVEAVHLIPLVEHYLETLATGNQEEVLDLLRKGVLTKWASLRS